MNFKLESWSPAVSVSHQPRRYTSSHFADSAEPKNRLEYLSSLLTEYSYQTRLRNRRAVCSLYTPTKFHVCVSNGWNAILLKGLNPLTSTLKPQNNGPLYSNAVIGTLAVNGWAVTFGTAKRGLGGLRPRPVPFSLYQM